MSREIPVRVIAHMCLHARAAAVWMGPEMVAARRRARLREGFLHQAAAVADVTLHALLKLKLSMLELLRSEPAPPLPSIIPPVSLDGAWPSKAARDDAARHTRSNTSRPSIGGLRRAPPPADAPAQATNVSSPNATASHNASSDDMLADGASDDQSAGDVGGAGGRGDGEGLRNEFLKIKVGACRKSWGEAMLT